VVSRAQVLAAGADRMAIEYRLKVGRLVEVHRAVYAVGHLPPSPHSRAMAAVLACGPEAVLSHRPAAALWGFAAPSHGPIEVSAPTAHRRRGVRVHRTRTLTPQDITTHFGIPVTTPARTLVDLADQLGDRALARAVNEARVLRRVSNQEIAAIVARSPGRRATSRISPLIEQLGGPTRSVFEDAFLRFTRAYRLGTPEVNFAIAAHEVDFLWRPERLIVELDSRTFHQTTRAFEEDRDRDADLLVAGLSVVRITWSRLTREPAREAGRLDALLRARRPKATA